jgi:hypothetical protein
MEKKSFEISAMKVILENQSLKLEVEEAVFGRTQFALLLHLACAPHPQGFVRA